MRLTLAAVGFTSTIAQVVLLRELVATFYGNELLLGLILMAWLAWVAVGAWGLPRYLPHPPFLSRWERKGGERGEGEGDAKTTSNFQLPISNLQSPIITCLSLAAALFPAQIALVRGARTLLGVTPGAFVELGPMVGAVLLILAPLCLLVGLLFTLGVQATVERGGTAGQGYVWESAGAVAGGALFSFVFIYWLNPFQTALLVGALDLAVAAYLSPFPGKVGFNFRPGSGSAPSQSPPHLLREVLAAGEEAAFPPPSDGGRQGGRGLVARILLLAASTLLLLGFLPLGDFLHRATLRWQWSDLAFAADSPYGRLTIQARDGQRAFFQDGLLVFETQGTLPEEVVHFPMLAYPGPLAPAAQAQARSVLLVGGGVAGDVREILKYPVAHVTYVELDPLLIEAAQAYLPAEDAAALRDPRLTLVLADGRQYVRTAASTFDVVILDLPEPATGALNRFYTREFFAEVRARLNPGGIFALGLPSSENYWSPELAQRNGSIYHTLRAVFPETLALSGETVFFLASTAPLEADPTVLVSRLIGRGISTRRVTPGYIEYVFTTDRFASGQRELEADRGERLNTDLAPICYYYDLVLWLSRFYPGLAQLALAGPAGRPGWWWIAAPLGLLVVGARWRRRWAVPLVIAGIGLSQMTLEMVILFAFQVRFGTLYAAVSLIVAAFMAGLALGGVAGNLLVGRGAWSVKRRACCAWRVPFFLRNMPSAPRLSLPAVQAAIVAWSGATLLVLSLPAPAIAFPLLAVVTGCLTGMAFPLAVALVEPRPTSPEHSGAGSSRAADNLIPSPSPTRRGERISPFPFRERGQGVRSGAAGMVYGADLVGGCLGALVSAVVWVPLLGIPQTCAVIALVGVAGLLALA
jgi:spermidine synthase